MKNLFKSALWACAALLVYGCTNDLDESGSVNAPDEGFQLTIEASHGDVTDETRTRIDPDGNRVLWNKDDRLSIVEVVDNTIIEGQNNIVAYMKEWRDDGKFAWFGTWLAKYVPGTTYDYLSSYPYRQSNSFKASDGVAMAYMTMPAEQTAPGLYKDKDQCVDANAMLLTAEDRAVVKERVGRPYQIDLAFNHAAAYVKLNFKGLELAKDEKIARIIFTAGLDDENDGETSAAANDNDVYLAGSCVYDFITHTTTPDLNGTPSRSVTLNIESLGIGASETPGTINKNLFAVENFSVYLATLPVPETANFNKFSITVVTAVNNKNYTKKSGDGAPALTLNAGMIRNINVSGQGFEAEKVTVYRKAKSVDDLIGKECVITSKRNNAIYTMENGNVTNSVKGVNIYDAGFGENIYEFDSDRYEDVLLNKDASEYTWSITAGNDGYTITSMQNPEIGLCAVSNETALSIKPMYTTDGNPTEKTTWTILYDEESSKFNIALSGTNNMYLQTDGTNVWYTTQFSNQTEIQVYYKTGNKMDSNSAVAEREEDPVEPAKYYKKVTSTTPGKNYIIAAEVEVGNDENKRTVLYTFNNYFNLRKDGQRVAVPLLKADANGGNSAGFEDANLDGFEEGDVYISTLGSYYTWTANGKFFDTTDNAASGNGLANSGGTLILSNARNTMDVTEYNGGVSINLTNNANLYLNLSNGLWTFRNQAKLYLFEESDEKPVYQQPDVYKKVNSPSANKEYIITTTSGGNVYAMTRDSGSISYVYATNLTEDSGFDVSDTEIKTFNTTCTFTFDGKGIYYTSSDVFQTKYYLKSATVSTTTTRPLQIGKQASGTQLSLTLNSGKNCWYHTFSSNVYSYIYLNNNTQWYAGYNNYTSPLTFWEKQ